MKKLGKILIIFIIMISIVGCGKKTERESSKLEVVKDSEAIDKLTNQVILFEGLSKTMDLYKKGNGEASDYTENDRIRYAIEYNISQLSAPVLTEQEKQQLKLKGIVDVSSYIELENVAKYVNKTFESSIKEYKTVEGCPKYTYDEESKKYYIQTECIMEDATIIVSKIDKITKLDNKYYVTVYAGLNDGNTVYGDFNKENQVRLLNETESYEITDEDKNQFTKFKYTFEKDGNGNYIFKSITKE